MLERRNMLIQDMRMQAQTINDQGMKWMVDEERVRNLNLDGKSEAERQANDNGNKIQISQAALDICQQLSELSEGEN